MDLKYVYWHKAIPKYAKNDKAYYIFQISKDIKDSITILKPRIDNG